MTRWFVAALTITFLTISATAPAQTRATTADLAGTVVDQQHGKAWHEDGEILAIISGHMIFQALARRIGFEADGEQMRSRRGECLREA